MRDKLRLTAADLGASQFLCVRLVARSLPPHPCPLPRGEGEPFPALKFLARAQTLHALAGDLRAAQAANQLFTLAAEHGTADYFDPSKISPHGIHLCYLRPGYLRPVFNS